nr:hypothetical protein [Nostoc commune]
MAHFRRTVLVTGSSQGVEPAWSLRSTARCCFFSGVSGASDDADYITGSTFFVDGGLLWNYQEQ